MENVTITNKQIKLIVKELFDNGNRGLICFKDDVLIDIYLNLDAMSGFQLVECIYDLEKLKEKAIEQECEVIKYEDMSNFSWLCDEYLYDFDEVSCFADNSGQAIETICYRLNDVHCFKCNGDVVLDLKE